MARPFGAWKSPITTQLITKGSLRLGAVRAESGYVVWNESRPLEGGRGVLVRAAVAPDGACGAATDITPAGFNVRTLVHEYGGGEFLVTPQAIYFSNMADQRLYRQSLGENDAIGKPEPLTAEGQPFRFADYVLDASRNRLIAAVEDHTDDRPSAVKNSIGAVSLDGAAADGSFLPVTTLVEGSDFFTAPRLSPDGLSLAYVSWDHPMMPWDETTLSVATLGNPTGMVTATRVVAGGVGGEPQAVLAPAWNPQDGSLFFITDTTGWWSVWRENTPGGDCSVLCDREGAEFAGPAWQLGAQPYAFLPNGQLLITFGGPGVDGGEQLALLDPSSATLTTIPMPAHGAFGNVAVTTTGDDGALLLALVGGSSSSPSGVKAAVASRASALIEGEGAAWTVLRPSSNVSIEPQYLAQPEKLEFPTENGRTAHMYYYAPTNGDYSSAGAEGELPPLLVKSHGGPTSATSSAFNLAIQFWTSRGIAVADVNYGGSTGFGKEYRQRLSTPPPGAESGGSWGIVDVDDCSNAARFLAEQGRVDPQRMAISGGSAGGYTTLACLAFRDVFAAGASHYGIGNLEALASDTHKFESRYLDRLVGPYPEAKQTYKERSPIHSVQQFSCPLVQFQGLEDQVVPPNQALEVFDALKGKGVPTACVLFEGEQHGFRRAPNIRRALDTELEFYGSVFGFTPPLPDDHVALAMGEKIVVPTGPAESGAAL